MVGFYKKGHKYGLYIGLKYVGGNEYEFFHWSAPGISVKPGDKEIDGKAIGSEYYDVIFSASDGSNARFCIDFTIRGPLAVISFDKSILESKETENTYKKVLKFYFDDKSDEAWNVIIKMYNNKKTCDEYEKFGDIKLLVKRLDKKDDIVIFIS